MTAGTSAARAAAGTPAGTPAAARTTAAEAGTLPVLWSLNGLRAAGALLVMLYHVNSFDLQVIRGSSAFYTGVGLFFVLSGFVLTWTARPGTPLRAFYTRRLARILPNYLTAFVLGLVVTVLVVGSQLDTGTVLAGLFLVQAWSPDQQVVFAMNGVAWSLSCEIAFYAAFPLLLVLLRRLRARGRVAVVGTALLIPPALGIIWPTLIPVLFHLPVARLPEFALGMATALAVQEGWRPRVPAPVLLGLLAACILGAAAVDVYPTALTALLAVVFAPLAARCAWGDIERRNRWALHPAVKLGGALSFTFYLLHELVIKTVLATPLRGPLSIAVVLVVSAALAFGMWRLVELPARAGILARTGQPGPRPPGQHGTAHRGPQHGRARGAATATTSVPVGRADAGGAPVVPEPALTRAADVDHVPAPRVVAGPAPDVTAPDGAPEPDEAGVRTASLRAVAPGTPDAATTWALRTPAAVAWGVTAPPEAPAPAPVDAPAPVAPAARPVLLPAAAPYALLGGAPVDGATALATTVLAAAQGRAAHAHDETRTAHDDARAADLAVTQQLASQRAAGVAAHAVGVLDAVRTDPAGAGDAAVPVWAPPAPPARSAHRAAVASGGSAWQPPAPPAVHRSPTR